jgi:hypothetical protein
LGHSCRCRCSGPILKAEPFTIIYAGARVVRVGGGSRPLWFGAIRQPNKGGEIEYSVTNRFPRHMPVDEQNTRFYRAVMTR